MSFFIGVGTVVNLVKVDIHINENQMIIVLRVNCQITILSVWLK